ncbi:MAG: putative glycoside hydrolase [Longimicrobiales bacterium]
MPAPIPGQLEALRATADPAGEDAVQPYPGALPGEAEPPIPGAGDEPPADRSGSGEARDRRDEGASDGAANRFPRPTYVRGIYLNAWTAGSWGRRGRLFDLVQRTELNTVVIDVKDATGYVSYPSQVPLAREVGATDEVRIRDLPALLGQLEEAGIYPIARIVVAKDPLLAEGRPDLAIQDSAGGAWLDQKEVKWLNLHHPEVWDYHLQLALEVVRAGFPEIQWDYVRFPDAPESLLSRAFYPEAHGRTKAEAVRAFLGYSREILGAEGVVVTADVFGVTTSYSRDVGIGQLWEAFIDQVDVALPMVYPSHYWTGSYGYEEPNAYPYEIVRRALRDAVRRSAAVEGAGATRPWLQDFTLGEPAYGSPEVRAQIQAAYDTGIQEWILWNPGSRYTEAALIPARGLPSWLEPVMRVGGEVVALSKRFEVLGEEDPGGGASAGAAPVLEDPTAPPVQTMRDAKGLRPVPIPDTVGPGGGPPVPDTVDVVGQGKAPAPLY